MFTSLYFIPFLTAAVILYLAMPGKYRAALLLMLSYLFCAALNLNSLLALLLISLFTYFSALRIDSLDPVNYKRKRKVLAALSVLACIFILTGYKLLTRLQISIPIGLSFYLFQAIGYLVDVYKRKYSAGTNFLNYGLYLAYFPKFISGPIEREDTFIVQLQNLDKVRVWNRGRLSSAAAFMLSGYFMKMVIADRLAVIVTNLFNAPDNYDSFWLIVGAFLYTIQIYCDFAGYSYIAIGCSKLFGIDLATNFFTPYCAKDITAFWRRWHISLSTWLRDYVYIPLGGNKKGFFRKCLNTIIVFILCGMWHGAGLNFFVWGFLHGIYSVTDSFLKKLKLTLPFKHFITFVEVSFAWIFFKASGLSSALSYIHNMFTQGFRPSEYPAVLNNLNINRVEIIIIITSILLLAGSDIISYRKNEPFPELIQHMPAFFRYLFFYILIILLFIFGIYGPGYQSEQFIYMQF